MKGSFTATGINVLSQGNRDSETERPEIKRNRKKKERERKKEIKSQTEKRKVKAPNYVCYIGQWCSFAASAIPASHVLVCELAKSL